MAHIESQSPATAGHIGVMSGTHSQSEPGTGAANPTHSPCWLAGHVIPAQAVSSHTQAHDGWVPVQALPGPHPPPQSPDVQAPPPLDELLEDDELDDDELVPPPV